MRKSQVMGLLLWLFAGLVVVFYYKYTSTKRLQEAQRVELDKVTNENATLKTHLQEEQEVSLARQARLDEILQEKEKLLGEIGGLSTRITDLETVLTGIKRELGVSDSDNSMLVSLVTSLKESKDALESQLATLNQEKAALENKYTSLQVEFEDLREKMRSIDYLKQAIQNIRLDRRLAKIKAQRDLDVRRLAEGNRGYLILAGQPTTNPRLKATVKVLPISSLAEKN